MEVNKLWNNWYITRGDKTNERDLWVYSHFKIIVIVFNDIAETSASSSLPNEASTGC